MKTTISRVILEEGMDLCEEIATICNEQILKNGRLEKNNKEIWGRILHKYNNWDWARAVGIMRELMDTHPEMFDARQDEAVLTADLILSRNWERGGKLGRILDTKQHKFDEWRLVMTIREVWNKAQGVDIPNDDKSKQKNLSTPKLFDIQ
jgi:hypothetical protein